MAITWQDAYPPPAPTGLVAAGYEIPAADAHGSPRYAIDLVWEPVEDGQLEGYLVYRQTAGDGQREPGPRLRLTPQPVGTPGFHDATALPGERYVYLVAAVGSNGRESTAVTTVVEPHLAP